MGLHWLTLPALLFSIQAFSLNWIDWTPGLFQKATAEKKLVILDLEAIWCHWCHVMDEKTYHDPKVAAFLDKNFITVKVDQDSRPDLSKRYSDYGWPATILFDSHGKELAKRAGFIEPGRMLALIEGLVKDPKPEESTPDRVLIAESPFLGDALKKSALENHFAQYDAKQDGFGRTHKFLFGNSDELMLRRAWRGEALDKTRGKNTLLRALALIDPVWGGGYQYSVHTWKEPHFEKIAETQYRNLLLYSTGYLLYHEPKFLKAASEVHRYVTTFLQGPDGAFYTSQDADLVKGEHSDGFFKLSDKDRRAKGMPSIDKHQYARENGLFISGLCAFSTASGDARATKQATQTARWALSQRSLGNGGFRHDEKDSAGPYLADTLEMGRGFLALYQVTGEREWLSHARAAADFLKTTFSYRSGDKVVGFQTTARSVASELPDMPDKDQNIKIARFTNLLSRYTGKKEYREMAEQAMRFLATKEVALETPTAGVILTDMELGDDPVHLTVTGKKSDPAAQELFLQANRYPMTYKRIEWLDAAEGPLPNADVPYPQLKTAAVFACVKGRCSLPIQSVKELHAKVDKLYH
ncbi:MAG: thioredoxin domain-containing protein [Deltaproteobacteria bacterium]|nr:thioredoxin domain-containing protein [Deltaproteobacteria bacterium]MBI3293780.1 thioredoxin domain-containing protein [Deltaproteobacteria bacterium]